MTTKFLDSLTPPNNAQVQAAIRSGYRQWFGYVAGNVPLWTVAQARALLDAMVGFTGIVAPDPLTTDMAPLVKTACDFYDALGILGGLALDTERFESNQPNLHPAVDSFNAACKAENLDATVYAGADYTGGAHLWQPAWTAAAGTIGPVPAAPEANQARQWAGNISFEGMLVDLNIAGPGFPFATKATEPAPSLGTCTVTFAVRGPDTEFHPEVRNAQVVMAHKSLYGGPIDGIFGPQTTAAVKTLQRNLGVKQDGILGGPEFSDLYGK